MELIVIYSIASMLLIIFPLTFLLVLLLVYKKLHRGNISQLNRLHSQNAFIIELTSFHDDITLLLEDVERLASCITDADHSDMVRSLEMDCQRKCVSLISETISGNAVIDALLHQKNKLCKSQGILFRNTAFALPQNGISEPELVSLLGNLLDNAIEAACKASSEAFVSISTHSEKNVWIVTVTNSKPPEHMPLKGHMQTTKADHNNHGIGIKIIKKITDRYDGVLSMKDHSDTFTTTVSMLDKT